MDNQALNILRMNALITAKEVLLLNQQILNINQEIIKSNHEIMTWTAKLIDDMEVGPGVATMVVGEDE